MGLDMYLYTNQYVSGYSFSKDAAFDQLVSLTKITPSADSPHIEVRTCVAYWRKANAIHDWFVRNVQDGEDNCGHYYVPREKLHELRDLAQRALDLFEAGEKKKAAELLTPTSGFFFGSTDLDEWYAEDLKNTITQLDALGPLLSLDPEDDLPKDDPRILLSFEYHSSW